MICNRLIRRGRMDVFGGIFVALAAKGGNLDQRTIDAHLQAVMIKSITLQLVPELPLDRDLGAAMIPVPSSGSAITLPLDRDLGAAMIFEARAA